MVERVCNTDEVLPIILPAAGVIILPCLLNRRKLRGAVDQPETLIFIQQHNT